MQVNDHQLLLPDGFKATKSMNRRRLVICILSAIKKQG